MRTAITHKLQCAREQVKAILGNDTVVVMGRNPSREALYTWLAEHGWTWDIRLQTWRNRQPGTHGPLKHPIVKASSFVLIRIMANREILDRDRENFALAFEAIGYDVIDFSQPIENRENGYSRVYLKARTK